VYREDLSLKNHLGGLQRKLMKISFNHVQQLMDVKAELGPVVAKNKANAARNEAYLVLHALSSSKNDAATVVVRALVSSLTCLIPGCFLSC
jgi:hypothetical protein